MKKTIKRQNGILINWNPKRKDNKKLLILGILIYKFNVVLIRIPTRFFLELDKMILKFSSKGGMFWENSIETCILSRVKQITSPGWMHETSAQAWCIGKTQRNRVEREVEEGTGMGNTCKSMADSCQCMTKTTTML